MKMFKSFLVGLAVAYIAFVVFLYFVQDQIMFAPKKLEVNYQFDFKNKFEERFLKRKNGWVVNYLVFKREKPERVILYFHGNAGALDSWGFAAEEISSRTNSDVWIFDYPGYGKSSGPVPQSVDSIVTLGELMLNELRLEYSDTPIYFYGRSLGTGVASALFSRSKSTPGVEGLILETPYIDIVSMAKAMIPIVPSFAIKVNLDNTILKDHLDRKILIFHGTEDRVIPFTHSSYLYQIFQEKISFSKIQNGGHNDLSKFPAYWASLTAFLN